MGPISTGASTGKNVFSASPPGYGGGPGYAAMSGSGFSVNLTGYYTVFAYAGTAADVAYLYGKYRVNYPSSLQLRVRRQLPFRGDRLQEHLVLQRVTRAGCYEREGEMNSTSLP